MLKSVYWLTIFDRNGNICAHEQHHCVIMIINVIILFNSIYKINRIFYLHVRPREFRSGKWSKTFGVPTWSSVWMSISNHERHCQLRHSRDSVYQWTPHGIYLKVYRRSVGLYRDRTVWSQSSGYAFLKLAKVLSPV